MISPLQLKDINKKIKKKKKKKSSCNSREL